MPSSDLMQRFLFDHTDIRGEVVTLDDSYRQVLEKCSAHPAVVRELLGQFLAAASLLSSTLKFNGSLTLQARGEGPLPLIMAECSHHKELRGIASPDDSADWEALAGANIGELIGKGTLAIIIEPEKGQRYQGIVPLDADSLGGCLQHYFEQSEQLPTRFWLAANGEQKLASGLLLQALPQQINTSAEENQAHWDTTTTLADTVKDEELLSLPHVELLYRLFNEEEVRLFDPVGIQFKCSCSQERSGKALVALGYDQVQNILAEQGAIDIDCQFCNQHYHFADKEVAELFPEKTLH